MMAGESPTYGVSSKMKKNGSANICRAVCKRHAIQTEKT
jgi:hypothetical protein